MSEVCVCRESYAFLCQLKESLSELWIKCHCAAAYTHTHAAWQFNDAYTLCTCAHVRAAWQI